MSVPEEIFIYTHINLTKKLNMECVETNQGQEERIDRKVLGIH